MPRPASRSVAGSSKALSRRPSGCLPRPDRFPNDSSPNCRRRCLSAQTRNGLRSSNNKAQPLASAEPRRIKGGASMIDRRRLMALGASLALAPVASRSALAQAWPTRPVRVIVPYAAGGSTDVVTRITPEWPPRAWGQQAVVENKPGAGTNLAAAVVAGSDPDGYTMLTGTSALATTRLLYRSLPYSLSDLAPVSMICSFPLLLLVPTSSPAKTVPEFIAFAKKNKGHTTYASPGVGTAPHLAGEMLKQMAGIEMTHVP